jgi:DNA processing protein
MGNSTSAQFHNLRLIRSARVGPVSYRQLLMRFGTAEAALEALPELLQKGGSRTVAIAPVDAVNREVAAIDKFGARLLFESDAQFPDLLRAMPGAPVALTVKGDGALLLRNACAIVGARNASASACKMAAFLAQGLAEAGIAVVSGLARGIDTAAHRGSLSHGTIAVVAGGIDFAYPPENAALQVEIAERGLLIAEMPFGTEPRARHFPHRNRIIAGLAAGTLIVEAAPKSGSLITARLAAEAGREVMAIPGSPMDPRSQGCNDLIRQGATLVQSVEDIAEMLTGFTGDARSAATLLDNRAEWVPEPSYDNIEAAEPDDGQRGDVRALLSFNFVDVDELVRQSGCEPSAVQLILLEMELAGTLERGAGGKVRLMG